jgi:hypothetical protein
MAIAIATEDSQSIVTRQLNYYQDDAKKKRKIVSKESGNELLALKERS